jgi:thymidylate synthase ThyX
VDQATHIHLLKHRIGVSINGESARYKELKEDKFYLPEDWDGIITTESIYPNVLIDKGEVPFAERGESEWLDILELYNNLGNNLYHQCLEDLTPILGRKRAKESARFFKTMSSQITMDVMFNWRSFAHFITLRADEHAQLEVRCVAKEMLQLVKDIPDNPFEHTISAFKF